MTTTEILMSPLDSLPDSVPIRLIRKIFIRIIIIIIIIIIRLNIYFNDKCVMRTKLDWTSAGKWLSALFSACDVLHHAVLIVCVFFFFFFFFFFVSRAGCGIRLHRFLVIVFSSASLLVSAHAQIDK